MSKNRIMKGIHAALDQDRKYWTEEQLAESALLRRTEELCEQNRQVIEQRYEKATDEAPDAGLAEIRRLVAEIEIRESDNKVLQLVKALELANADLEELQHLALRKIASIRDAGDARVIEVLGAFSDILGAYKEGLGKAEGYMSGAFKAAQLEALAEAEEILRQPPLDTAVGEQLIGLAKTWGEQLRKSQDKHDLTLSMFWASQAEKGEGWRND